MTYLVVSNDPDRLVNDALQFAQNYHPGDVFWIKRTADKKEITVDVVNNLIDQANLVAVSGKKLFIVFEAHLLNTSAQNKLLKTIENANDDTTFLFLCANLNHILPTIKSRSIVRYQHHTDNLTLKNLAANNPNSRQIYTAAKNLLAATNINQAITHLPLLSAPENLALSLDALNQALRTATLPATKKLAVYLAIATISRNLDANCNPVNTFDNLLLALF